MVIGNFDGVHLGHCTMVHSAVQEAQKNGLAPLVLTSLEDYGFCGKGEAAAFVGDGRIRLGGELPLNTAGGLLSEGYIHGWNLILEGVRQIRGTSTAQVEDVEFSLVTSGWGAPTSALILSR